MRGIEAFKGDACDGLPLRKMHLYEVRPRKDRRGFDLINANLARTKTRTVLRIVDRLIFLRENGAV